MSILVLDGPEKAGKTTLIQQITGLHPAVIVRKWHQPDSYDAYANALLEDRERPLVIWDRGWPSDAVYSGLMPGVTRRFTANPQWAEDKLTSLLGTVGLRVILLGPCAEILAARRTPDDLPVDPQAEQEAYLAYAKRFSWLTFVEGSEQLAHMLLSTMMVLELGTDNTTHLILHKENLP